MEPVIKEKGWFTKQNIQNFIHHFVAEKLPFAQMQITVGHAFQKFLAGLEKPMELGKMRVMKEPNYSRFREILRNPKLFGDRVLSKLVIDSEKVGISQNSFHMVHEGFWDLYCRKPATTDLTSKKLDGWHELIALRVPTWEAPAEPEEGEEPASLDDQGLPVKAVTRIRIPFK